MTLAHPEALTDEALRLYAAGQFARACDRFGRAADREPENVVRRGDVGRCFESWGWHVLGEGRADEAMVLFRQGLDDSPAAPGLLKGLGVSAVHAGRPDEALAPLEAVARVEPDAHTRLLLARLYDRRDDIPHAVLHLRALLAREPGHVDARRLLAKLERERLSEDSFERETTEHFIVKSRGASDRETRRGAARIAETVHDRVRAQLGFRPQQRIMVVLYDDPMQFRSVTGVHGWTSGVFDGKIRLPLGTATPVAREFERLVLHEYAHAAIHELTRGRAPRWLHEGLAQLIEGAPVDPLLRVPGRPTLAGVEALVGDPDALRARTGYDLALWIAHDLVDRGGMDSVRGLLARLGRGEPLGEAIGRVYGVRMTELESQWRTLLGG